MISFPRPLARLKRRLEAPARGALTLSVTLHDFLLVTYAVPAERARPHVPAGLPLDVLPGPDGEPLAFVQSTCFFNDNLHWSPTPGGPPGLSYHQSTYRILIRRNKRRGAFFLRTYVGTASAFTSQRAVAREVDYAPFSVAIVGDPACGRYDAYTVRAACDRGQTALDIRALSEPAVTPSPFGRFDDMAFFLTQREEGYYAPAAAPAGFWGLMPVEHHVLRPVAVELTSARLSLWTDLEILTPDDLLRPLAAFVQPTVVFTTFPPRLVKLA